MKNHKQNWKPVALEGAFLNDNLTDLIGIEELTDYDGKIIKTKTLKRKSSAKATSEPKIKKKAKEVKVPEHIPGQYVLNPNRKIKRKKKVAKEVKRKPEVGTELLLNDKPKLSVDDMTAWMKFGLSNELIRALADLGFKEPTQIQHLTLGPSILGRRDILGAAETGSGKTLAFGLPIINGILNLKDKNSKSKVKPRKKVNLESNNEETCKNDELGLVKTFTADEIDMSKPLYALILTPTRELAVQVKNHLVAAAKYTDIRVAVVLGGMASVKQERVLTKCPEIVVATPGRLWELIQEGNEHLSKIDYINYLAIDETDRMVERGHFQELHNLLERINSNPERKQIRQNFVFSATLTLVHDLPSYLITRKKLGKGRSILKLTPGQKIQKLIEMVGMTNPKVVDITRETGTAGSLTECRITCPAEEKDYYLYYFLKRHPGRTLIFCNSIGCVKRSTNLLTLLKCDPLPLHASMHQKQRLKNLERFRDSPHGVLIATDVASRGLDIPQVQHVIHYQVPRTAENYIHRSGRTARALSEGITVLIMDPTELKNYTKICYTLGKTEDIPLFPVTDDMLSAVKQRVNLARDLDKLELKSRRFNSESNWFHKAVEEMDIVVDERDMPSNIQMDDETISHQKKAINAKRKQLNALLGKSIFPKGFSFKYPTLNLNLNLEQNQNDKDAISTMKDALKNYTRSGKNKFGSVIQNFKKPKHTIIRERKLSKQRNKDMKKARKKKLKQNKENGNFDE